MNNVTDCGQHTRVVSNSVTNGEVDLCYRDPIARIHLVRGLAVHADMEGSTNAAGVAVSKAGLALAKGSLEAAAKAIKSAIE